MSGDIALNSVIETLVYLSVAVCAAFGIVMLFYHALSEPKRYRGILLNKGEGKAELENKLCDLADRQGDFCTDNIFVLVPETEKKNAELSEYILRLGFDCVYYRESDGRQQKRVEAQRKR